MLSDIKSKNESTEKVVDEASEKPRMSYAQLIAEALIDAPDRMLTVSNIFNAITTKHPYYKMNVKTWQNSMRQTLRTSKNFTKVAKMASSKGVIF